MNTAIEQVEQIAVPAGKLAAVATILEMREPPAVRPDPPGVRAAMRRATPVDPDWYVSVFRRIGEHYLWSARLAMNVSELESILSDPLYEVHAIDVDGCVEGLLELDFRRPRLCELAYFGVSSALIGTGIGRWAMNRATAHVWSRPMDCFHVHTCTLDHPGTLGFYVRTGFVPVQRIVEIQNDPRLAGLIPRDAAPQIPII